MESRIGSDLLAVLQAVIAGLPVGQALADLPACPAAGTGPLSCVVVDHQAGEVDVYGISGVQGPCTVPLALLTGAGVVRPPPPSQAAAAPAGGPQQLALF